MGLVQWIPGPVKRPMARALARAKGYWRPSPLEVVKANTPQAFNYFWRRRDYVGQWYLDSPRLLFYEQVAAYCAQLLSQRPGSRPWRVIDAGCGTGHFLKALESQCNGSPPLELHGFDFSRVAIRQARRLLPHARLSVQDMKRHQLQRGGFDLVICMEALEHLTEPDVALHQLVSLVHPGGEVVLTVPNGQFDVWDGHVNFWTPQTLRSWLEPLGQTQVELLCEEESLLARLRPSAHVQPAGLAA